MIKVFQVFRLALLGLSTLNTAFLTAQAQGTNWTQTSAPGGDWWSVASSSDGTHLVALEDYIWTSTNSGTTWTQTAASSTNWGAVDWRGVASSSDGTHLVAVAGVSGLDPRGGIWTYVLPTPNLGISQSGNSVIVTWPNSGNYILQQNSDLTVAAGWTASCYPVTTNSPSGTNSITITPPVENLFFRLANP